MELLLALLSFTVFTSFLIYVYRKHGILSSISTSYYVLKNKWMFRLFTFASALPLMFIDQNDLLVAAVTFWLYVGVAADIRQDKITSSVHVAGATGCIVLGYAYLTFTLGLWWLTAVSLIPLGYMYFTKMKNHTWWIEALAYYTIITGLVISILSKTI